MIFEVITQNWSKPLKKLQAVAFDPPLFYSEPFIAALMQNDSNSIYFAVLRSGLEWQIALPMIRKSGNTWSNLTSKGWDNLKPIQAKLLTREDITFFWKNLLVHFSCIHLVNLSREALFALPQAKFDIKQRTFKCPFIDLTRIESVENIVSNSFFKKIKRESRVAKRDGFVFESFEFEKLTIEERILKYNNLLVLHGKRFKEKEEASMFLEKYTVNLHTNLLKQQALKGVFIEGKRNDTCVSSFYCFLTEERMAYFNSGIEPTLGKYSLGTVSIYYLIEYCLENGIIFLDFLRGTEAYKKHWTNNSDQNYSVYLSNGNFLTRMKISKYFVENQINWLGRKQALKIVIKALCKKQVAL